MIILKVTKNQGFTILLQDTFFEKPEKNQIDPSPPHHPNCFRVKVLHKSRFRYGVKWCEVSVFPVKEFNLAINLIYNFQSRSLSRQA